MGMCWRDIRALQEVGEGFGHRVSERKEEETKTRGSGQQENLNSAA